MELVDGGNAVTGNESGRMMSGNECVPIESNISISDLSKGFDQSELEKMNFWVEDELDRGGPLMSTFKSLTDGEAVRNIAPSCYVEDVLLKTDSFIAKGFMGTLHLMNGPDLASASLVIPRRNDLKRGVLKIFSTVSWTGKFVFDDPNLCIATGFGTIQAVHLLNSQR